MNIRSAQARDLDACLALDSSYETEYVWQMDSTRVNNAITIGFRVTRLPRAMRVGGEVSRELVLENFERGECFLVAEDERGIHGFLDATANAWNGQATLNHLAVAAEQRRRGVAKDLLRAGLNWAREQNLRTMFVAASTKNYPATALLQKQGFAFCGFNDQYFANRDIALFFALTVR